MGGVGFSEDHSQRRLCTVRWWSGYYACIHVCVGVCMRRFVGSSLLETETPSERQCCFKWVINQAEANEQLMVLNWDSNHPMNFHLKHGVRRTSGTSDFSGREGFCRFNCALYSRGEVEGKWHSLNPNMFQCFKGAQALNINRRKPNTNPCSPTLLSRR